MFLPLTADLRGGQHNPSSVNKDTKQVEHPSLVEMPRKSNGVAIIYFLCCMQILAADAGGPWMFSYSADCVMVADAGV